LEWSARDQKVAGSGSEIEVVIDSSVAVKWFTRENETDEAIAIKSGHVRGTTEVWVSDLLYHEVANALRFKDDFDEKKLALAVENLFGLHLNTRPVDQDLLNSAASIAYHSEVTINDAIPVALAKLRGTVCITADENTQFKRTKAKGYPVQLLSRETR